MLILACFVITFIFASFVEYWLHRLMHLWPWFGGNFTSHYGHHASNRASGVLWEFKNYCGAVPIVLPLFFIAQSAGIGAFLGGFTYAAVAAYAHQIQHDNPTKCFWMKMPVHYVHHKHNQWHHNFGITVDWWDHIFATYKLVEWPTEQELNQPQLGLLQLKWW